ncbi:protein SON-like [Ctenocephalides felis]|uniref:protein SON-like n=1 Tax=Ctenocephalides felis TaxID=7515 RepID=UPI000E6E3C43|nr:protein SON-like [Ctenocephalides felis]
MNQKKSFRINIKQNVPPGQRSHDPVNRTIKPEEVVVVRSKGEGSKPLFSRDNIVVNQDFNSSDSDDAKYKRSKYENERQNSKNYRRRNSSSRSPSVDVDYKHKSKTLVRHKRRSRSLSPENSAIKKHYLKEKSPYYVDEQREKDRIARKYDRRKTRSRSRSPSRGNYRRSRGSERRSRSLDNRRASHKRTRSPTRKRTPEEEDSYYVDPQREKDRLREERKRYEKILKEIRSKSHYRYPSRSPSRKYVESESRYRYRRSRTRSISRSRGSRSYDRDWSVMRYERIRERPAYVEPSYPAPHGYHGYREELYCQPMAPMIMPPYSLPRMAAPPRYMPAHASGYGHPPLRSSYYPSSRSSLYHVQPSRYPYRPI